MKYSIEPKDKIFVKGHGFLSFAKNIGKNLGNKYSQKLLDSWKKSTTDALKRAIQKTTEATGDLIGNKIADKITSVSKSSKELHSKELHLQNNDANNEIVVPKERYISSEKRQQILDELRLM